jgi:hypothetical protein
MINQWIAAICAVTSISITTTANAQSASALVSRGISAYRALEYDSAAVLLQRGLAATGSGAVTGPTRIEALTYLGAIEKWRGNASAAASAFVQTLAINPRYRIDELVFPPPITSAFNEARLTTAYTTIVAPNDVTITAGSQMVEFRLYSSAPHNVEVIVSGDRPATSQQIYSGMVSDSMTLRWNGLDTTRKVAMSGNLAVLVSPRTGSVRGETRLPLVVQMLPVDTLKTPPRPAAPRAAGVSTSHDSPLRALALGTVAGATAIFLPDIIGDKSSAMPERFAVGGTLGVAGILGFLKGRQDIRSDAENANAARRYELWQRAADSVKIENEKRLATPRLHIIAGQQSMRSPGG